MNLEVALGGLDSARGRLLGVAGPSLRPLLRDRALRVGVYGLVAVTTALLATALAPLWLLALGPLVLGVPHLFADLRYLVARPGLHRRNGFWLAVAGPAAASFVVPHAWVGLMAVAGVAAVARGSVARRAFVALASIALALAAREHHRMADVLFAHGHNLVALGLWWAWAARPRWHLAVPVAFAAGALAILTGALDGLAFGRLFGGGPLGVDALVAVTTPPGLARTAPVLALRLLLVFAFAQSVHYAVWVRLVPDDDRPRPGLRSFASSARAAIADCGTPLVLATVCIAVVLAVWALFGSVSAARDGYLRLALFHGPLELGAGALLWIEGGLPRRAAER